MGALQANHSSSMIKALVVMAMAAMATTTARGLLRLRLPLLPRLIPTTDTTDLATMVTLAILTPMEGMATTMARGLLMLLLLPRLTLTTVSMASAPTTATLATPMFRMLLSTARGLLKPPLPPSLLLIPTTATAMLDTMATLATH